jgi:hypothetical protein
MRGNIKEIQSTVVGSSVFRDKSSIKENSMDEETKQ